MCTHQRLVKNVYTGATFYVKCGKCKACLQEKAYKRSYRIKCEVCPEKIALFVTLTYDRSSCPFVLQSDIDDRKEILPVYREFSTRRVRKVTSNGVKYLDRRIYEPVLLNEIVHPDYESFLFREKIRHLAFRHDRVGVCLYSDLQLFKKRLAINLQRKYNFNEKYKVYGCSEYGETSSRPHFHLLIFISPDDEALFRSAISEAWPFASHRRTEKYIEVARDAANYLASYVNSGVRVHGFLSKNFKAKCSYSKDFGMADKLFSLDSVLSKVERRDLSYLRGVGPRGMEQYFNFPIPKYVVNRYFPLFKGYSRFTDSEILDVLLCFAGFRRNVKIPLISLDKLLSIDYSRDDIGKIGIRLSNAYEKYCKLRGLPRDESSFYDYCLTFREAWKVYKNTQLRLWYDDDSYDIKYKYDNVNELLRGFVHSPFTLQAMNMTKAKYIENPNWFPQVVNRTFKYQSIYDFRCKERKINNAVMASNNYFF